MMKPRHLAAGFLLGAVALLGVEGRTAQADLLAVTFNDELISIDTTTGAGTLIGTIDTPGIFAFGLAFRGSDLYTYDQANDLVLQLNPTTGAVLDSIDIGTNLLGEGAMDFRSDGIGFLAAAGTSSQLLSFDITVPDSTPITTPGGLTPSLDGLAFDSADVLYGVSQGATSSSNPSLYTINQTNGATTLVGSLGLVADYILGGLAFDTDGALYAALSEGSGAPSYLYRVNKSTGAATLVGNGIGFNGVSGLTANAGTPPVPEPSSLVLASLGVAGLVGARARRAHRCG